MYQLSATQELLSKSLGFNRCTLQSILCHFLHAACRMQIRTNQNYQKIYPLPAISIPAPHTKMNSNQVELDFMIETERREGREKETVFEFISPYYNFTIYA